MAIVLSNGQVQKREFNLPDKVKINSLSVAFDDKTILSDISLKFKENKVTAIMGPSGCGKTVLIRSLNRMHDLNSTAKISGNVFLDEIDLYSNSFDPYHHRQKIGMVFQKPNPFPTMSIYDNVIAGLKLNGLRDKDRLNTIAERSLKMAYLWDEVKDRLDIPATDLSGGQQQRLCIARALAVKPDVLLMDEPTSALDPNSTLMIEDALRELKKDMTVIMVTHNLEQAKRVADFVVFMYLGKVIEHGEINQMFQNPKQDLTRKYLSGIFG
ncbi:MAG: phosphate ABC transporter ATP-binding protein PstB [Nitrosopumilaceae archaeon]